MQKKCQNVMLSMAQFDSSDVYTIKVVHSKVNAGFSIMVNAYLQCFDIYGIPFQPFKLPSPTIDTRLVNLMLSEPEVLKFIGQCFAYILIMKPYNNRKFVCGFFSQTQPAEIQCLIRYSLAKAIGVKNTLQSKLNS